MSEKKKVIPYSKQPVHWKPEQIHFQQWLALPTYKRVPKTHAGLAQVLGVRQATLSHWKKIPGFMDAVEGYRVKTLERRLSDLYEAMMTHAINGNHHYAKLVLEVIRDRFNVKEVVVTDGREKTLTNEELVDRMFGILKEADKEGRLDKDVFLNAFNQQSPRGEA
jgi:hypothetical protein